MATWGRQRQLLILGTSVLVVLVIVGIILALILHKSPMCTDGIQNGKETGVDCGGSCQYLCSVGLTQPSVRFATPVFPESGRTDVIAYINNSNQNAGITHAQYTLELRSADGTLVTQKEGTVNLPPATIAPIYIPHAYDGSQVVTQAFLTLNPQSVQYPQNYQKPVLPYANTAQVSNENTDSPKITSLLSNPTARTMYGVTVIATVFDANDNAIAASQTFVTALPAQGTAPLVFTWNTPFRAPVARIEVLPATGS